MLRLLTDTILSAVYPHTCRTCNAEVNRIFDGVSCPSCWDATRIFDGAEPKCLKCGALDELQPKERSHCPHCKVQHYDTARSTGVYQNAVAGAVLFLKEKPHIGQRISRAFVEAAWREIDSRADLIVPVPLSKRRQRERGHNQAEVLARLISSELKIKLDRGSLIRSRHTPVHRAGMDGKAREKTVAKAFEVARPKLIVGKRIVLIDDVFTSGATVSHCARVLKENGASRVDVFTLARAVLQ
ncbi:MAG: ComF family protein [Acidobacteria bacterium]|nr:ComF family protein [Acidobacteriota bacterium]MCA1609001.1 ComF family protein [Acidobacteriota bacterium]